MEETPKIIKIDDDSSSSKSREVSTAVVEEKEELIQWEEEEEKEVKEKQVLTLKVFKFGNGWDYLMIAIGIILNLAAGTALPLFMTAFGGMMDSLNGMSEKGRDFNWYILLEIYLGLFSFFCCGVGAWFFELTAEKQLRGIRSGYIQAVMRQEIGWFDTYDSGVLSAKLNQNCVDIRDALGLKLGQMFMFLGMFVSGYVLGLVDGWKLALVLTAPMPLLAAGGYVMMKMIAGAGSAQQELYGKAGSVAEETLMSIRSVVAFALEETSIERYGTQLIKVMQKGVKGAYAKAGSLAGVMGVLFLTYSLGFWYGATLVAADLDKHGDACQDIPGTCFSGGDAMSVFFDVIIAAFSLGQGAPSISAFAKASAAVLNVFTVLNRQSAIDPWDPQGDTGSCVGDIVFKDVEFEYPARKGHKIFSSLNLTIEKGKTVALVGPSGCGKSTIIQLVERYYDPLSGHVLFNGQDCREYNLKSLREQIAIVSQEPRLFAKSIAENIGFGKNEATQEEIEEAAKRANAHDFIMKFPEGYKTFVGEGGGQLSGGQKQRIAIARAILRQPAILILDEATSALDNESEKIVQMTLDKLISEGCRTTIVIAHRLTTVRNADKIIVLDRIDENGAQVAEQGTHDELMKIETGIYHALVVSQTLVKPGDPGYEDWKHSATLELAEQFVEELPPQEQSIVRLASKFSRNDSKLHHLGSKKPSKKPSKKISKKGEELEYPPPSMGTVLKMMREDWWMLGLGAAGAALNGCVFPAFGVVFSYFVPVFFLPTPKEITDQASFWACIFIAVAAGVAIANLLQMTFFEKAGQKLACNLRRQLFTQIIYQEMGFFDDPKHSTGTLAEMLSSDTMLVKGWVGDNLGIMIQNGTALVVAIILSFIASWNLGLVSLAAFVLLAPVVFVQSKMMAGASMSSLADDDVETAGYIMNETVTNIRTVAAYGMEPVMSGAYDKIVIRDYNKGKFNACIAGLLWGLSQFMQFAVQALCLWYGGKLMNEGSIGMQQMMQAIFALIMAAMGAGQTMIFMTDGNKAKGAASRIWAILDRAPKIDARSPDGEMLVTCEGRIDLDDVKFSYPARPEIPVYKGLTFNIEPGQTVALVGSSGCGKSTVVQLVERFYDVGGDALLPINDVIGSESMEKLTSRKVAAQGGSVLVDGHNVKDINVKALRKRIGLVSQEPMLFGTTIRQNIKMGRAGATDEEVEAAAKMANAHNFIQQLPSQYDTEVGKFGGRMSGGQKQRIAIARAIIRDPTILILDEATSALDAESERIVQQALDNLMLHTKRTTIVIAHRLSTVRNADKIVVLVNDNNGGSIVAEQGTHDELMKIPHGTYRGLITLAEGKH